MCSQLPSFAEDRRYPSQPRRDIWERLASFEAAAAEVEEAVLSCDPATVDRFRVVYPKALHAIAVHQEDLRKQPPSLRMSGWRFRLQVCEALMTLGAGCHPSLDLAQRRSAFERCRYLLIVAERQRAALPHDRIYAHVIRLLHAAARLKFADILRGSRVRDAQHLKRLDSAMEAYRELGYRFFGRVTS
jgi:hypothetical protein